MSSVKVVYVAGPITASTPEEIAGNIEMGRRAGIAIFKMGAYPVVPHLNVPHGIIKEGVTIEQIYLGDLEILSRCDAIFLLPGWQESRGCQYEVAWAAYHDILDFENLADLEEWVKS